MSSFKRKLQKVFVQSTTAIGAEKQTVCQYRFIARGFGHGGLGWGIYDKKAGKYLKDAEIKRMSEEALSEIWAN